MKETVSNKRDQRTIGGLVQWRGVTPLKV